ncbi:GNAT family N-acetyltransferase [Asticcacaulis tiandongensis]|uniref:GNAT family N-acetyltransferase n=1 Tax=Asticcacaulis tiandongensis TaxID=2565365 RepID=UPI00112677F5|nr:GNAT family N-acetyltransferase [Asticcacaulis tiandongensis]
MHIRPYQSSDAEGLSAIYDRAVRVTGPRSYSPAQVTAWTALAPDAARLEALMTNRWRFVAVTTEPIAFIDLEMDGHIDLFYAAPEVTGTGIGKQLYQRTEAFALTQGLTRLYAEASEVALPFFTRQGFTCLHRRDFEVGGVAIHNYAVEKQLQPD